MLGSAGAAGYPNSSEGGMGFMTDRGLGKINPGDKFYFRYRIDGMQWRIDPDCDGGGDYEWFQNWSIKDEDGQTAGLLLPPDRDMETMDEGGGWHVLRIIQDDCGISPDDGSNRHLQKVQFQPTTPPE